MCKLKDDHYLERISQLNCTCEKDGEVCVSCSARSAINAAALVLRDARIEIEKRVTTLKESCRKINEL